MYCIHMHLYMYTYKYTYVHIIQICAASFFFLAINIVATSALVFAFKRVKQHMCKTHMSFTSSRFQAINITALQLPRRAHVPCAMNSPRPCTWYCEHATLSSLHYTNQQHKPQRALPHILQYTLYRTLPRTLQRAQQNALQHEFQHPQQENNASHSAVHNATPTTTLTETRTA